VAINLLSNALDVLWTHDDGDGDDLWYFLLVCLSIRKTDNDEDNDAINIKKLFNVEHFL
jgi:hypothetical protein